VILAVRFRRGSNVKRSNPPTSRRLMETLWIGLPFSIGMSILAGGASLVKQDVLPGRATTVWIEPNEFGRYHLSRGWLDIPGK